MEIESLNCPNCGAPVSKPDGCEYCGTRFRKKKVVIYTKDIPIVRITKDGIEITQEKRTGGWKE